MTLQDLLADLDDLKSALYTLAESGQLEVNTCDQVQELLRDAYTLLEEAE